MSFPKGINGRKRSDFTRRQALSRIPPFWPQEWVVVADVAEARDLAGRTLQVRSLTCTITKPDQRPAPWHVHFMIGRSLPVGAVLRLATPGEIAAAQQRIHHLEGRK